MPSPTELLPVVSGESVLEEPPSQKRQEANIDTHAAAAPDGLEDNHGQWEKHECLSR